MIKNVLMISSDRLIFEEGSEVRSRMIDYGGLVKELHVIVFNKRIKNQESKIEKQRIADNIWIYPTNSRSRWFYIKDAINIGKKIIYDFKFVIDDSLITSQDPFETGLVGWLIRRETGIKLQIQIHTDFLSPYFKRESLLNRIRFIIAQFLIPRANCIRAVSLRIKKSVSEKFKVYNIEILPIFVDVKKIRETPIKDNLRKKYPQFDFIILMAGRLTVEKNIPLAIDVMKDILEKYPKTGLVIVGAGPKEKKLKAKARKMEANIIFEPWSDDLISYYKTASVFLLTSNYEGFGRTVIEAVTASCPVIMTDVGLAGEIIRDGYSGFVVPVGDEEKLKKVLFKIIRDRLLFNDFVVSAEYMSAVLFDKQEYLNAYKKLWEDCVS